MNSGLLPFRPVGVAIVDCLVKFPQEFTALCVIPKLIEEKPAINIIE